ncbi:MAG: hypothetical protein LC799_01545 [Actinobacteria bacterium]|nr:hypothetical protein [Actinomycetota bacterium]
MTAPVRVLYFCVPCGGKQAYGSRKDARKAARVFHPQERGLGAYECSSENGIWHIGHSHRKDPRWVP